jgi:hypothetical protein
MMVPASDTSYEHSSDERENAMMSETDYSLKRMLALAAMGFAV